MRKTFVIAVRDYLAAVKTKSFLVGLILMPVLMGGGIVVGRLAQDIKDTKTRKVAVIDRTIPVDEEGTPTTLPAGGTPLSQVLMAKADQRTAELTGPDGEPTGPIFEVESVYPKGNSQEALDQLRFELSEQIRDGELFAFVEIGPKVLGAPPADLGALLEDNQALADRAAAGETTDEDRSRAADIVEQYGIRYTSQSTTYIALQAWLRQVLQPEINTRRLAGAGVPPAKVLELIVPAEVIPRAMAEKNEAGEIVYPSDPNPITTFLIPVFCVFLIFTVVMTAASPLTTNIVEEKQLRIAEVLLGSVRPFELMLGKLLGGVGVSLTLAAIYFAGGVYAASQFGALSVVTPGMIAWFLVFASLATLMYGSLFVAAGAAVTNLKEAQNFLTPIILIVVAPMFVLPNVIQNPDGTLARAITWFPLTTPVAVVLRQSVPPDMDVTEKLLAAGLSLLTTLLLIWIAGRIFRFGMLHTDKAAALKDMMKWVVKG